MAGIKRDINGITIKEDYMYELIKEIKEKVQILVDEYDIQDISIYIDDGNDIDHITVPKHTKDVYVEVRF